MFFQLLKNLLENKIRFHFIGISKNDLPNDIKNKNIICEGYVENAIQEIKNSDLFFCVTPHPLGFRTRICEALSLGVVY